MLVLITDIWLALSLLCLFRGQSSSLCVSQEKRHFYQMHLYQMHLYILFIRQISGILDSDWSVITLCGPFYFVLEFIL